MKKTLGVLIAALFIMGALVQSAKAEGALLKFEGGVGVSGSFIQMVDPDTFLPLDGCPSAAMLRGVSGGALAWVVDKLEATLKENGELKVEAKGVVFDPDDPIILEFFPALAGINVVPFFFATLSCLDAAGNVVNVDTVAFPASLEGDSSILDVIDVPDVCIAPVVLVRGITPDPDFCDPWFAATGF